MRHRNTELLLGYWTKLRGPRRVPARADVEPRALKRLLPDLFIIDRADRNNYPFRLAGTRMCWLFGRELRDANFLHFFRGACERQARDTFEHALRIASPASIYAIAETLDHRTLRAEILVVPVADPNGRISRLLGAYTPLDPIMTLAERKLITQWIVSADMVTDGTQTIVKDEDPPGGPNITGTRKTSPAPYLKLVVSRDDPSSSVKRDQDIEFWDPFDSFWRPAF